MSHTRPAGCQRTQTTNCPGQGCEVPGNLESFSSLSQGIDGIYFCRLTWLCEKVPVIFMSTPALEG